MQQIEARTTPVRSRVRPGDAPLGGVTLLGMAILLLASCMNDGSPSFRETASITAPTVVTNQSVDRAGVEAGELPTKSSELRPGVALLEMQTAATDSIAKWREALDKSANVSSRTAPSGVMSLRGSFSPEQLTQWRKSLDRVAQLSKRGDSAVIMRRLLLDAMEAPTEAESRAIMRRFHDRIQARRQTTGGSGSLTPVALSPTGRHPDSGPSAIETECTTEREGTTYVGECATQQEADEVVTECTTEWEGTTYVGECATQQEADEVVAEIDAVVDEINADHGEMVALCVATEQEPWLCNEQESEASKALAEWAADATSGLSGQVSQSLWLEDSGQLAPCNSTFVPGLVIAVERSSCIDQAIQGTAALVSAVGAALWGKQFISTAMQTGLNRAAMFGIRLSVIGAGFLAGYTIGGAINCYLQ